jgi:hypothetical protein
MAGLLPTSVLSENLDLGINGRPRIGASKGDSAPRKGLGKQVVAGAQAGPVKVRKPLGDATNRQNVGATNQQNVTLGKAAVESKPKQQTELPPVEMMHSVPPSEPASIDPSGLNLNSLVDEFSSLQGATFGESFFGESSTAFAEEPLSPLLDISPLLLPAAVCEPQMAQGPLPLLAAPTVEPDSHSAQPRSLFQRAVSPPPELELGLMIPIESDLELAQEQDDARQDGPDASHESRRLSPLALTAKEAWSDALAEVQRAVAAADAAEAAAEAEAKAMAEMEAQTEAMVEATSVVANAVAGAVETANASGDGAMSGEEDMDLADD